MLTIVVPAHNEAGKIGKTLQTLLSTSAVDSIVVITNGCTDTTDAEITSLNSSKIKVYNYAEQLGYDIPRALGAEQALAEKSDYIGFVDGNMQYSGLVESMSILTTDMEKYDLSLVEVMSSNPTRWSPALKIIAYLNREIGLGNTVVTTTCPPFIISRKALLGMSLADVAVPPMMLAKTFQNKYTIKVVGKVSYGTIKNAIVTGDKRNKISDTIIGDCAEAISYLKGKRERPVIYDGYNSQRDFNILKGV